MKGKGLAQERKGFTEEREGVVPEREGLAEEREGPGQARRRGPHGRKGLTVEGRPSRKNGEGEPRSAVVRFD